MVYVRLDSAAQYIKCVIYFAEERGQDSRHSVLHPIGQEFSRPRDFRTHTTSAHGSEDFREHDKYAEGENPSHNLFCAERQNAKGRSMSTVSKYV